MIIQECKVESVLTSEHEIGEAVRIVMICTGGSCPEDISIWYFFAEHVSECHSGMPIIN